VSSTVQPLADPVIAKYKAQYESLRAQLPGAPELRDQAIEVFAREGLPTRRVEAWRYTDLRPLTRSEFSSGVSSKVTRSDLDPYKLPGAAVFVFIDGNFAPDLSANDDLPDDVVFSSLAEALKSEDKELVDELGTVADFETAGFAALNTALMQDGAVIRIADNASIEKPIQCLFVSANDSPVETHMRNLIVAGVNSSANLLQTFVTLGKSSGFSEVVAETILKDGANLRHVVHQDQSKTAWHINLHAVQVGRAANLNSFVLSSGARLSRNEIRASLENEGADCSLNGIALVRGRQHCDNTTDVDHAASHCHSNQMYKNVLDDRARTVFQGRIHVAPDSQKTDAHQMNRNLLLSRNAQADSKPELIIHADDVKCSHGATVGDMDQDALFYLQSRGIDVVTARNMMVHAFAAELVESLPEDAIRAYLERAIKTWLEGGALVEEAA